ncbi:MAG: ribosome maturation factor RimP [Negativicutes bacterium]|nr:ribosome maturation factor RimP [Negativicutes bacterium]
MKTPLERCKEIAEKIASELGYEIYQVQLLREMGHLILRITIDHPDQISHEDCEKFSKAIDPALDEADPIRSNYYLEVSSPGLERELRHDRDLQRFLGSLVKVICRKAVLEQKTLVGYLSAFEQDSITLEQNGNQVVIPRAAIKKIQLEIDWNR